MRRKIVSIVVMGVMSLMLAGCGSLGKKEPPTPTPRPTPKVIEAATPTPIVWSGQEEPSETVLSPTPTEIWIPTEKPTETPVPTEKPKATATPKPKATAAPKPTATPKPQKTEKSSYEKGILTANGFESEWIGVRFTAPKEMTMATQTELDETMRLLEETLYGGKTGETLDYAKLAVVYEMEAVQQPDSMLMQVLVEKLTEDADSLEEYVEQMKEELALFAGSGINYFIDDTLYPVNIGGQEFYNFGIITEYGSELTVYQESYLKEQNGRLILISFTSDKEADSQIQKVLDCFSAY